MTYQISLSKGLSEMYIDIKHLILDKQKYSGPLVKVKGKFSSWYENEKTKARYLLERFETWRNPW